MHTLVPYWSAYTICPNNLWKPKRVVKKLSAELCTKSFIHHTQITRVRVTSKCSSQRFEKRIQREPNCELRTVSILHRRVEPNNIEVLVYTLRIVEGPHFVRPNSSVRYSFKSSFRLPKAKWFLS